MTKRGRHRTPKQKAIYFWGRHAVTAAIANPEREIDKILGTRDALAPLDLPPMLPIQYCDVTDLARFVPRDAPHQGMVALVQPLENMWLEDALLPAADTKRPLLLLDGVTDPHNIGAIFRTAAAFDAVAVVTQDRHAPPESGVVAKSASGALEMVPWVRVVNLSRALDEIGEHGYWRIGLTGHVDATLDAALSPNKNALILGAEGEGMRPNVEGRCDELARLPIHARMESLNVSNAAAIALYAATMKSLGQ